MNNFTGLFIAQDCSSEQQQYANDLSQRYCFDVLKNYPNQGLVLVCDANGLGLMNAGEKKQSPVKAEFTSPELHYRLQKSTAKSESIVKAIGNKGQPWTVLDATPGLGRDASVLAHFGCVVVMVERSPVVAALLEDGLIQLKSRQPELAEKMTLIHGNSVTTMLTWREQQGANQAPDAVYLDPMFPHRKKSALVKKEMQLFQQLLGHDEDADSLLMPALALAKKRVVVKRPNSAAVLNAHTPTMSVTMKKHRFDVYINHQTGEKND
ncbi:16S rRNA methyltransferase [Alteromonas sediminis]|uniref:Ribosomal RNA small subunit methyltransferase J n=1 Tax=Alteromonas sediminis TaxID=2259342 RepID=A0A3N5XX67_9ALTE|nr:class I SAM-dependent methyltransferase [Alteromonas sediminis]RPJ65372.1 16S rRNA methyltransferase [Alteromonas sediminis]